MKILMLFVVFLLLVAVCWPLALLAIILFPVIWVIAIPFRILGFAVGGVLALIHALFYLPARILGHHPGRHRF